mgnify:FL=1
MSDRNNIPHVRDYSNVDHVSGHDNVHYMNECNNLYYTSEHNDLHHVSKPNIFLLVDNWWHKRQLMILLCFYKLQTKIFKGV